jgi:hypothetical protein
VQTIREIRRKRAGGRVSLVVALAASVLSLATLTVPASADEPARAISATQALGCCVCRGTDGGDATAVRACSDARNANSCVSACKAIGADSIAFGYQQTCSEGCAGFPTQSLK